MSNGQISDNASRCVMLHATFWIDPANKERRNDFHPNDDWEARSHLPQSQSFQRPPPPRAPPASGPIAWGTLSVSVGRTSRMWLRSRLACARTKSCSRLSAERNFTRRPGAPSWKAIISNSRQVLPVQSGDHMSLSSSSRLRKALGITVPPSVSPALTR